MQLGGGVGHSGDEVQSHPAIRPFQKRRIVDWITAIGNAGSRKQQREAAGLVLFFWWFIWNERKSRVFEHKEKSFLQVVEQITKAIKLHVEP
jgi:hypothetical protein